MADGVVYDQQVKWWMEMESMEVDGHTHLRCLFSCVCQKNQRRINGYQHIGYIYFIV